MEKSLIIGIDEFTVVLRKKKRVDSLKWPRIAQDIITEFLQKSKLSDLEDEFGHIRTIDAGFNSGYNAGMSLIDRPYYLNISFHEVYDNMGVCVKFSAQAFAALKRSYAKVFGKEFHFFEFLNEIISKNYSVRLSRIDFTADFFDYPSLDDKNGYISPNELYKKFLSGELKVINSLGRVCKYKESAISQSGEFQTVYFGSRKQNVPLLIRFYDKRFEQISKKGIYLDKALACNSWLRLELRFTHKYAHQITDYIQKNVNSEKELNRFIAKSISEKISFVDRETEYPIEISKNIFDIAAGLDDKVLSLSSARDNTLLQSINYLMNDSGFFTTLYKVQKIWDTETALWFLDYLKKIFFDEFSPQVDKISELKKDAKYYISKHKCELEKYDFKEYLLNKK